ncbi:MAG TPA: LysE family translocator [Kiritimatiellia bacterium]|nr:LysE family translocator [Kiritimatiellia bacterium]HMO99845.1 LysE family translocator [Kiritimatiellia bacterium]
MSTSAILAFIAIMAGLAAMPSASVVLVVTRSATRGFNNGVAVAVGIVLADLLFVTLAVVGMTTFAQSAGALFSIIRYAGGAYIIYLGISLIRSRNGEWQSADDAGPSTLMASMMSGLLLTLGDLKAILFYASLFPALFDLRLFTVADCAIIAAITVVVVGGVKVVYAGLARKVALAWLGGGRSRSVKRIAGGVLAGAGLAVLLKS